MEWGNWLEAREDYVKERLVEVYGDPSIEEWLQNQRSAERPEVDHEWWGFLLGISDRLVLPAWGKEVQLLWKYVTPSLEPWPELKRRYPNPYLAAVNHLLHMLRSDVKVFWGELWGPIFTIREERYCSGLTVVPPDSMEEGDSALSLCSLQSIHVMDAVLAEWACGAPKALQARGFLCDTLAGVLADTRREAEGVFYSMQ